MSIVRKSPRLHGLFPLIAVAVLLIGLAQAMQPAVLQPGLETVSLVALRTERLGDAASYVQPAPAFLGVIAPVRPFMPSSFLRFDFKQNLRHWPVLSGDISRSPPFFAAL